MLLSSGGSRDEDKQPRGPAQLPESAGQTIMRGVPSLAPEIKEIIDIDWRVQRSGSPRHLCVDWGAGAPHWYMQGGGGGWQLELPLLIIHNHLLAMVRHDIIEWPSVNRFTAIFPPTQLVLALRAGHLRTRMRLRVPLFPICGRVPTVSDGRTKAQFQKETNWLLGVLVRVVRGGCAN